MQRMRVKAVSKDYSMVFANSTVFVAIGRLRDVITPHGPKIEFHSDFIALDAVARSCIHSIDQNRTQLVGMCRCT